MTPAVSKTPVDVAAFLQRRTTMHNVDEQDFLSALDVAVRGYFQDRLNATGGDEAAMTDAINDIATFIYARMDCESPGSPVRGDA